MKIGQKVFTTFYNKMNKKGVVCGEPKKNVYSEDFNVTEETQIPVLFDCGTTENINFNFLIAYEDCSQLPEQYILPSSLNLQIRKSEIETIKDAQKIVKLESIYSGDNLPNIKRTYQGTKILCEKLSVDFLEKIKHLGYDLVNDVYSFNED
tara:strand:- start:5646 stop:6098 length:453 start_codon:yes stop_codon:yes gene_type:complete